MEGDMEQELVREQQQAAKCPPLSVELWQMIFYQFSSLDDMSTMLNCLTVCRLFHSYMVGPVFLDTIVISHTKQIPLLLTHLLKDPPRARYIRSLRFRLRMIDEDIDDEHEDLIVLASELASVPHLLQLATNLRALYNPPFLSAALDATMTSIQTRSKLKTLSLAFPVELDLDTTQCLDQEEAYALCNSMPLVNCLSLARSHTEWLLAPYVRH